MYGEKSPLINKTVPKTITIAQRIAAESMESQVQTQKGNQYLAALIGKLKIIIVFIKKLINCLI